MTTIELSDADAQAFKDFLRYRDTFEVLRVSRVFEMRDGSVTLHFSHEGKIMDVTANMRLFKRRSMALTVIQTKPII